MPSSGLCLLYAAQVLDRGVLPYFREAVLPLDPELQAALTTEGISPELRACAVCGKAFLPEGRQAYCSDACKAEGNRRKSRERMRKMREKRPGGCYDLPPPKA